MNIHLPGIVVADAKKLSLQLGTIKAEPVLALPLYLCCRPIANMQPENRLVFTV
jgi:hypothetical protein